VLPIEFANKTCGELFTIKNLGWTLSATRPSQHQCAMYFVTKSGIKYILDRVHIHWHDKYNHHGTEHTVNGQGEAVEVQLVHYKSGFTDLNAAFDDAGKGNIAIISIRYTVSPSGMIPTEAPEIDRLIVFNDYQSEQLRYKNASYSANVGDFFPYDLIGKALPRENLPMFYYDGSITAPGCDSIVSWFLVQQTVMLSQGEMAQLRKFSRLSKTEAEQGLGFDLEANCRPTVSVKGRPIIAWPRIIEPNMTSDSAPTSTSADSSEKKKGLSTGAIIGISVGCSAVVASAVAAVVVVVVLKKKRSGYESINDS